MATIGCVYTVDPKPRTPEDVVEALFRERPARRADSAVEPVAQHKRVWSSLTYDEGDRHVDAETEVFTWMGQETDARRYDGQPMVCLIDGQRSLWTSCARHLPRDRVEIVDLLHVTSYLWDAAYLFHAEGSEQASAFVRDRLLRILRGEVGYVIGGLRQMATKRKGSKRRLSAAKQEALTKICNYFHRNRHRMHYDEYLAAGFPVASGVIEGACRHLVKDRMERAGMRWTIDGAQAMLDLRSTHINDQWSTFQTHRIHTETKRLYPQRQLLQRLEFQLTI
ncbi:MAG: hypothetical protein GY700_08975 [Propionibacteriaceae bacterium]|nr:hypothetical protein [Propionibacteriaceae bacterium]